MREINFRGKRLDNGEWVYGFLIQYENGWFICNFIGDAYQYEVDPSTVGQFTGLKDKNGIKIYDGDILVTKSELNQPRGVLYHKIIGKVIKEKGMAYLEGKSINGFIEEGLEINDYKILLLSPRIYEVIGNIYENPELLEVN